MTKRKPPLRTDDEHIAGVKRIDASPEEVGLSLLTPHARKMREKARQRRLAKTRAQSKS